MPKRGYKQRIIALVRGRSLKTVSRIIQAYRDERRKNDAAHRRRPRSKANAQDLCSVAAVNDKPFQSTKHVIGALGLDNLGDSTVRRRLREAGLRSRIAAQKHLLTSGKTPEVHY
ncbi:hypothetical protein HPB48_007059 [Haemaphysalis longicornis]|uniref:Transposase n=1 Tax=Haemaphysalis longicornis TaxID=44386 RepID=A0A9J6FBH4_HAELO|nr:hypothetical protein HPB48_007059 [Haemaphysalis longicornis]